MRAGGRAGAEAFRRPTPASLADFRVDDRVGVTAKVREQWEATYPHVEPWSLYGHVAYIGQGLVWVKDSSGGEWGMPPSGLEHID